MRILIMVMVTAAIGYVLAYRGDFDFRRMAVTLVGTGLLSGASCSLNCYIERDLDALMPRTCNRPLPSGIIKPLAALVYGIVLLITGSILLFSINQLTGWLGLTAAFVYLAIYTPAKRYTWMNTSIGALPGAIPPLIGWAAARGELGLGAWILFAMHFLLPGYTAATTRKPAFACFQFWKLTAKRPSCSLFFRLWHFYQFPSCFMG